MAFVSLFSVRGFHKVGTVQLGLNSVLRKKIQKRLAISSCSLAYDVDQLQTTTDLTQHNKLVLFYNHSHR